MNFEKAEKASFAKSKADLHEDSAILEEERNQLVIITVIYRLF